MPTIRDLVAAIRQRESREGREGVEVAVVLGRNGLLIDRQALAGFDSEQLPAHL